MILDQYINNYFHKFGFIHDYLKRLVVNHFCIAINYNKYYIIALPFFQSAKISKLVINSINNFFER